jgi:hypothetical protein
VREGDKLTTFMYRMPWKSGNLNLLEPFGPHRACYGTPLPLPFTIYYVLCTKHYVLCIAFVRWPEDGLKEDRNTLPS